MLTNVLQYVNYSVYAFLLTLIRGNKVAHYLFPLTQSTNTTLDFDNASENAELWLINAAQVLISLSSY